MMLYTPFYKAYGIRYLSQFVSPVVIDISTLSFPKNSTLHNFTISDVINPVTKDTLWLKSSKDIVVRTVTSYRGNQEGSVIPLSRNILSIISDMAKKEKSILFKLPNASLMFKANSLFVYHYGVLNYMYKYHMHPMNNYYKFRNAFTTAILNLVNDLDTDTELIKNRNKFIVLELPDSLPGIKMLNTLAEKFNLARMKYLSSYRDYIILEFWKALTPEFRDKSILNLIPNEYLSRVNVIFTINKKAIILNLGLLFGSIRDYNLSLTVENLNLDIDVIEDGVNISTEAREVKQKLKYTAIRKLFYLLIYSVINNEYNKSSKLDEKTSNIASFTSSSTNTDKTVNVDEVLKNDVVSKDEDIEDDEDNLYPKDDNNSKLLDEEGDDTNYELDFDTGNFADLELANNQELDKLDKVYDSLDELYKDKEDTKSKITKNVDMLKSNKVISKKAADDFLDVLAMQDKLGDPYEDSKSSLEELLNDTNDEYEIDKKKMEITDSISVVDKNANVNVVNTITKEYLTNQYKKDMLRVIYAIQNDNAVITKYEVSQESSIMGSMETHHVEFKFLNGKRASFKLHVPKIDEHGDIIISCNKYSLRFQRVEQIIRKLGPNEVVLNSYYGKLFIDRAAVKRNDKSYWFYRSLSKMLQTDPNLKEIIPNTDMITDVTLPYQYSYISRTTESFIYGEYNFYFGYYDRKHLLAKPDDLSKVEGKEYILVGYNSKGPIVMDKNSKLFNYINNSYVALPDLLDILHLEDTNMPIEFATISILGTKVPIVYPLCSYVGISSLLKMLKTKYETYPAGKRVDKDPSKYYIVKFKDYSLRIEKDNNVNDLILGGLTELDKDLREVNLTDLDKPDKINFLLAKVGYNTSFITELKLLNNMFIDPIAETMLKRMKEPTTFKALLIRACELLTIERYSHPNDIGGSVIKGYERVPGMVYNIIVKALKEYENSIRYSSGRFNIYPYELINQLTDDSTNVLVDDINPLSMVKQKDDVSYLGKGGRQKEGMSKSTRILHSSEIGTISEGAKDNGAVGITAYLTASPSLDTIRGNVAKTDIKKNGWSSILSTSAMLAPFGTRDDVKRLTI